MPIIKPVVTAPWGDTAIPVTDTVQPTQGYIQAGWLQSAVPPPREYFNWLLNFCSNGVRYFSRRGIADYDPGETYLVGDVVRGDTGVLCMSLQNNNLNNLPSTQSAWWGPINLYLRTQAEITATVVPTNYAFPPGSVLRYGADPLGVADSAPAWRRAIACNARVFDDYPGGGAYLFNSSVNVNRYPIRIEGSAKSIRGGTGGTVITLAAAAGASAYAFTTTVFTSALCLQHLSVALQSTNLGQGLFLATQDLRGSLFHDLALVTTDQTSANNSVAINLQGGSGFTGGVDIDNCYFANLKIGVSLSGPCTTVRIAHCEMYGNTAAAVSYAVDIASTCTNPLLEGNTFDGWTSGVYNQGNGLRQIGNNFQASAGYSFDWVTSTGCLSIGDDSPDNSPSANFVYNNASGNYVISPSFGFWVDSQPLHAFRGFQDLGLNTPSGYYVTPAYSLANFSAAGAMTFAPTAGQVKCYRYCRKSGEMTVNFTVSGATLGGAASSAIQIAIPGGLFPAIPAGGNITEVVRVFNNGAWVAGIAQVLPTSNLIQIFCDLTGATPWTTGGVTSFDGKIIFPIIS
jgi:hypothetical protein